MMFGFIITIAVFFANNYTDDHPDFHREFSWETAPFCKKWCGPVTTRGLFIGLGASMAWPITLAIAIYMYSVILKRYLDITNFWAFMDRELFNPCDLFKKKVK